MQPEISTVLDSGRRPQHDGIFAFGCTMLEVDAGSALTTTRMLACHMRLCLGRLWDGSKDSGMSLFYPSAHSPIN